MGRVEPMGRSERMGERTRAPGTRVRRTHSRRSRSPRPQGAREVTSLELCGPELPPSRSIQLQCTMCTMITEAATTRVDLAATLLPSGKTAVPADTRAPPEAELEARPEPHQAPHQEAHCHQAEAMEARTYPPPYRFRERNYPPYDSERVHSPYHEVYHMERSNPPNHQVQREHEREQHGHI